MPSCKIAIRGNGTYPTTTPRSYPISFQPFCYDRLVMVESRSLIPAGFAMTALSYHQEPVGADSRGGSPGTGTGRSNTRKASHGPIRAPRESGSTYQQKGGSQDSIPKCGYRAEGCSGDDRCSIRRSRGSTKGMLVFRSRLRRTRGRVWVWCGCNQDSFKGDGYGGCSDHGINLDGALDLD